MRLIIQTLILSLIFIWNKIILCQDDAIDFIYNSIPYKVFNVEHGSSQHMQVAKQANVIVIAVGDAGIMVIDSQFNSHTFKSPDQSFIFCASITADAKYIFSGMKDKVGIFELVNFNSLNLINTIKTESVIITDIQLYLNEDVLFILGIHGELRWYDISNKQNIKQLGEILYEMMILVKAIFSPDQNVLYIAADWDGVLALSIDKTTDNKILRKPAPNSFRQIVVTSDNKYIFGMDSWYGVYLLHKLTDLLIDGDDLENKNFDIIKMDSLNLNRDIGLYSYISISSNNLFLYVGARSLGIIIFNIRDPFNPIFFQQLQQTGQSISLCLSPKLNTHTDDIFDNKYIFYSNSVSVLVFQKQLPNLYQQIPNLFNINQSQFFIAGASILKQQCRISSNNKYFFGAFDTNSLVVFKINIPIKNSIKPVTMNIQYQYSDKNQIMEKTDTIKGYDTENEVSLSFNVNDVQFSKDGKYMYFPSAQYKFSIIAYKFEIIISENEEYSFKFVKGLSYDKFNFSQSINFSVDEQYAVFSLISGVLLVDLVKFEFISEFIIEGLVGVVCGVVLSHDNKHTLIVSQNVGLFILDNSSDFHNPQLVNSWRTNGGQSLLRSTSDKIIYLIDGFNGLILLDSTKFPEIIVISKFVIAGWTNYISFTFNENYGIISTLDTDMLTLVDLHDKSNPRLIMKSSIKGHDSTTSCLDPSTLQYGFTTNQKGVRYFRMQSLVSIHVEREIKKSKKQESRLMSNNEPFEIGNSYIIHFVPLYKKENQIISDIYYYKNLVLFSLPSWIQIDRDNQSDPNVQTILNIDVSRECLDSQNNKINFLIIIIKTCLELSESSFIFNTEALTTTKEESEIIYNYLKQNNYINGAGCVTDYFNPTVKEIIPLKNAFNSQTSDQEKLITIEKYTSQTLKLSINFNQYVFDVISSLKFDQTNQNQMVQAIQDYISVHLSFPALNSPFIFVQKAYSNVIIYLNDEQTVMKMEGNIEDINKVFQENIIYFDLSQKEDVKQTLSGGKTIDVQIADNFNFDLSYTFKIPDEVKFLKQKSQILLQKSLQEQVNRQYEDAELYIEVAFLIEFDKQSFIDPENISFIYEFQYELNGQFIPIPSDSFIKFDNNNLRLVGTPPESYLFKIINLRLKATNGYTIIYEEFYFKVNLMTFGYVFNKALQILGPIAFVLGVYQKRSKFMNLYFKKNTMFSTEIAAVNQLYRKKLAIIGQDYQLSCLFFENLLKVKRKKLLKLGLFKFQQSLKNNDKNQIQNNNIGTPRDNNMTQSLNNSSINLQQFDTKRITNSNIQNQIDSDANVLCSNRNKQKSEINQNQIINNLKLQNDDQSKISETNDQFQTKQIQNQFNRFQTIQPKNENEQFRLDIKFLHKKVIFKDFKRSLSTKQYKDSNQDKNNVNFNSQKSNIEVDESNKQDYQFIKNLVIQQDGTINLDNIFQLMLEYNLKIKQSQQTYEIINYKNEMLNQYSRFYNCFKACIVRFLIDGDEKTKYFYRFLKKYALQVGKSHQNDWYKFYVTVQATNDLDVYGIPIPFSKTFLKEETLFDIYKILEFIPQNEEKENFSYLIISQFQINPHLIREILFANALGLEFVPGKSILRCRGDSLHLQNHSIISVEAFKLVENGIFLGLRRFFNMNYEALPISKYQSLPSWLQYDFKNGVIILEGIPSKLDVDHILIVVYNTIQFASFQFHLKIEEMINLPEANLQQDENNEERILQSSQIHQNRKKSPSAIQNPQTYFKQSQILSARNSIFKQNNTSVKQAIDIYSVNEPESIISNKQEDMIKSFEDEIPEDHTSQTKQLNEFDNAVTSPPLFPHSPKFQGDKLNLL